MAKINLWEEIYVKLKEEINSNKYKKGDRFLKIKDICEKFGVSETTARRVLDELGKERLIIKKQRIGTIINRIKQKLYLFIPPYWNIKDLSSLHIIQAKILKGIFKESINENIEIEFVDEKTFLRNLKNEIYLFFYNSLEIEKEERILKEGNLPNLIFIHSAIPLRNVHTIRIDLYKGAYIAVKHLIERGYKKIGFISGPLSNEWFLPRFEGYLSALREKRIGFNIEFVKETDGEKKKNDWIAFEELMKNKVDAIFCANDARAIHLLEYCYKKKIKVPEDIAICGFDNFSPAEKTNPPLTTVETFLEKIGEKSVELGIKLLQGEIKEIQDIVIEPELVIRKST